VCAEATRRGYAFDASKAGPQRRVPRIAVTRGQLEYEWRHLLRKLRRRNPAQYAALRGQRPRAHPLMRVREGPVESWERT
jgi:hypothetical protein